MENPFKISKDHWTIENPRLWVVKAKGVPYHELCKIKASKHGDGFNEKEEDKDQPKEREKTLFLILLEKMNFIEIKFHSNDKSTLLTLKKLQKYHGSKDWLSYPYAFATNTMMDKHWAKVNNTLLHSKERQWSISLGNSYSNALNTIWKWPICQELPKDSKPQITQDMTWHSSTLNYEEEQIERSEG